MPTSRRSSRNGETRRPCTASSPCGQACYMLASRALHQSRRARRVLRSPYRAARCRRNSLAALPSRASETHERSGRASSSSECFPLAVETHRIPLGWARVPLISSIAGIGARAGEDRFISFGKISLPNSGLPTVTIVGIWPCHAWRIMRVALMIAAAGSSDHTDAHSLRHVAPRCARGFRCGARMDVDCAARARVPPRARQSSRRTPISVVETRGFLEVD